MLLFNFFLYSLHFVWYLIFLVKFSFESCTKANPLYFYALQIMDNWMQIAYFHQLLSTVEMSYPNMSEKKRYPCSKTVTTLNRLHVWKAVCQLTVWRQSIPTSYFWQVHYIWERKLPFIEWIRGYKVHLLQYVLQRFMS